MHRVLCGKTLGLKFWEKARKGREEHYGELPWPAISKNIRAGDLREDDREISKHEHSFKDCVSAAFKHAEHKNSLLQKDHRAWSTARRTCREKRATAATSTRARDVQVAEAIEKLEDLKRSEHRMDNRLSREDLDCFMEVWREKRDAKAVTLRSKTSQEEKTTSHGSSTTRGEKDEERSYLLPADTTNRRRRCRENKHQKLVWKMHCRDKRQKERCVLRAWAPSMNLPEAPEARQADRSGSRWAISST